jgi:hypothetical protein
MKAFARSIDDAWLSNRKLESISSAFEPEFPEKCNDES